MLLSHRIRLVATPIQCEYFARAAGTARRVWNWALAEWQRQMKGGMRPDAMALKKQFNAIKYAHPDWLDSEGRPWLRTIHRDAHAQPFAYLAKAWTSYIAWRKAGKCAYPPCFKKKGKCRDSFYVANDKFRVEGKCAILLKVGRVELAEVLRFHGKIMGATVSRTADHWFFSIQVDVSNGVALQHRLKNDVVGVDLGVSVAATLSTGEKIAGPRPLRSALRRLRIRSRRHARRVKAARVTMGIAGAIPTGLRLPQSANQIKGARRLARLHARIAQIRADFTHNLTTRLCRENQAVAIENLHVKGMVANARLARSIVDVGFFEVRRQLQYKARRDDTLLVVVDRWFPSSQLCSVCGRQNRSLTLAERMWTCSCGIRHDRDVNAAINLKRLATGALAARTALPVASLAAMPGTAARIVLAGGGEVTLVRYEHGQQDGAGQEQNGAAVYARFNSRHVHYPLCSDRNECKAVSGTVSLWQL